MRRNAKGRSKESTWKVILLRTQLAHPLGRWHFVPKEVPQVCGMWISCTGAGTPPNTAASTPEQERYKKQGAEEEKSRKQGVVD